jgi:hypothetical protein
LYSLSEQAAAATAAQLEATAAVLQQQSAKQPAVDEAPLSPGPGKVGSKHALAEPYCQMQHIYNSLP